MLAANDDFLEAPSLWAVVGEVPSTLIKMPHNISYDGGLNMVHWRSFIDDEPATPYIRTVFVDFGHSPLW